MQNEKNQWNDCESLKLNEGLSGRIQPNKEAPNLPMYKGTPNCLMYCSGAKSPTVASSLLPVASLVPVKQKTARRRFNVQSLRGVMDQTVYDGWHVNTTKFTTPSICVCAKTIKTQPTGKSTVSRTTGYI